MVLVEPPPPLAQDGRCTLAAHELHDHEFDHCIAVKDRSDTVCSSIAVDSGRGGAMKLAIAGAIVLGIDLCLGRRGLFLAWFLAVPG